MEKHGNRPGKRDFTALVDSSPCAIVSYDTEGIVTHWNPAAEALFGWTAGEAVGNRLPFIPAEKQSEFKELLDRSLRGESFLAQALRRRKADGSPVVVSVSSAPLSGPGGTVYGVVEILSDVTEREEEEESRERLLTALDQAVDSVVVTDANGVILYVNAAFERKSGISREEASGRKPWGAVGRGRAWRGTLFNRNKDGTPFEEEAVVSPVRDRSGRIVSYIVVQRGPALCGKEAEPAQREASTASSRSGLELFRPVPLELNGILKGMERMLCRLAGGGVELSLSFGRGIPLVKATPGKVEQLAAMLASHACSLLPGGGWVSVRTEREKIDPSGDASRPGLPPGLHAVLCVEAAGRGMGRVDGTAPPEAVKIVREFGGQLRFEHPEGRGCSFTVSLPGIEPSAKERPVGQRSPDALTPGGGTVLLVEDEDVVRHPAAEILRLCGYDVIEARNGKEALLLSEAHRGKIDLLLTDVMMPKMDGVELAERLRKTRPATRTLFMSGYTNQVSIQRSEGSVAFLQKPFTAEALSLKVGETLHI